MCEKLAWREGCALSAVVLLAAALIWGFFIPSSAVSADFFLRIRDWKTGEVYASVPAKAGSVLFFGWIHSLEKIPWNEYYHVDEDLSLVLDAITFPAFGAGIPENKGKVCYVENGLIHMEEIGERFGEIIWLNSHTATQEILLDGKYVARGSALPHHARLRLIIDRGQVLDP
ncbi:MAG: DUF1850 domain-containing protein [Synergistaceae bacterium]|jgi:hypothetical protein|nr:DUF1850 domain-containing protein [Synergistaceae bacterium]